MKKYLLTMAFFFGLAAGLQSQPASAREKTARWANDHTRREISPDRPMFLGGWRWFSAEEFIEGNLIPADIRPYLVFWMGTADHDLMRRLDAAGVYFMISGGHRADLRNTAHKNVFISREEKINLFESYPHFLGFCYWEPGYGHFAYDNVREDLELAARYGGYLNLQNRGMSDVTEGWIKTDREFVEMLGANHDHVITTTRQTTTHSAMTGVSDTLGNWLGGIGGFRGFNSQFFMWAEGGCMNSSARRPAPATCRHGRRSSPRRKH